MPTNPTPETREVLVLGRAGGGRDGAPGGVNYYSRGVEYRLEPGDVAEIPVLVAQHLIAEGLACDPNALVDLDAEATDLDLADLDPPAPLDLEHLDGIADLDGPA